MARRTKRQIMDDIFNFLKTEEVESFHDRLTSLVDADRVTTGAAYYIYVPYEWSGYRAFMKLLDRASKSKDYFNFIDDNLTKWEFTYCWDKIQEDYQKTKEFIEFNENCPFEESQMQVLKAKGELKYSGEEEK